MATPKRIIVPITELRFQMLVALTTTPRHALTALGKPHHQLHEQYRRELIERLTRGWDDWEIVRAVHAAEASNLQALVAMGRVKLLDQSR